MLRPTLAPALVMALSIGPAAVAQEPEPEVFADGLDFPTNAAFAPDGRLFFTEKNTGRVRVVEGGRLLPEPFTQVPSTRTAESGLLGIALHPDFEREPWVYLTYSSRETGRNELIRVRADDNVGGETEALLQLPEVSPYHDGGDLAFGPDGRLFVVTGEAHNPARAQDPGDLAGKVLRLEPDGSAADNPLPGPVYSMGHRNSFGICVDPETGNVWQTENGPTTNDEVNLIEPGGNYGWPVVRGAAGDPRFVDPQIDFEEIIVPTGCAIYPHPHLGSQSEGALFFGDYGGRLWRVVLNEERDAVERFHQLRTGLGDITDVLVGPDERLYVVTSQRILRLPARVESPEPGPSPETPGPTEPGPVDVPSVPGDGDRGDVPWLLLTGLGVILGVAAAVWFARRGSI